MAQKRISDFFGAGGPKSKKSCVVDDDESVNLLSSSEDEEEIEPVEDAEVPRPLGDAHPSRSTVQPGASPQAAPAARASTMTSLAALEKPWPNRLINYLFLVSPCLPDFLCTLPMFFI